MNETNLLQAASHLDFTGPYLELFDTTDSDNPISIAQLNSD